MTPGQVRRRVLPRERKDRVGARSNMRLLLFCHSLLSDWNHGNAHFLRGLVTELVAQGHSVRAYEPQDAWSVRHLVEEIGHLPEEELHRTYPALDIVRYTPDGVDWDEVLAAADLVIAHEWNPPSLIRELGRRRIRSSRFRLLLHDTHHRSVSDPNSLAEFDLSGYDGVLAFGEAVRERYVRAGWTRFAFTFHEAADTRVFFPRSPGAPVRDLIWIGNWGDEERTRELSEFLLAPAAALGLSGTVHGVRYPAEAVAAVESAGLRFAGWLPNYQVPGAFARHRVTLHVPRRPYTTSLPGIPTIRVFEALACGIPLVSAPWEDTEGLFREGDLVRVESGGEAERALRWLLEDDAAAAEFARRGRERILERHTCVHRAEQLCQIAAEIGVARVRGPGQREYTPEEARP